MKNFLSVIAAVLMASALLVGCGDSQSAETKIGVIAGLNVTEQAYNDVMSNAIGASAAEMGRHRFRSINFVAR